MNKDRRRKINEIIEEIQGQLNDLEEIKEEEQEYFDKLPEGVQLSAKGERVYELISYLEDGISNLEDSLTNLRELL